MLFLAGVYTDSSVDLSGSSICNPSTVCARESYMTEHWFDSPDVQEAVQSIKMLKAHLVITRCSNDQEQNLKED
jgi:hypothetical protein